MSITITTYLVGVFLLVSLKSSFDFTDQIWYDVYMINKYKVLMSENDQTFSIEYIGRTQQEAKRQAQEQYPNATILTVSWGI